MARKHWEALQRQNPYMLLDATSTIFVAYGATQYLPVIGQTRLRLGNQRGRRLDTTAYVTKDKDESLLGKEDAMALSILCQDLEGGPPLDHHHHSRTPSPPPHHQEAAIPVKWDEEDEADRCRRNDRDRSRTPARDTGDGRRNRNGNPRHLQASNVNCATPAGPLGYQLRGETNSEILSPPALAPHVGQGRRSGRMRSAARDIASRPPQGMEYEIVAPPNHHRQRMRYAYAYIEFCHYL